MYAHKLTILGFALLVLAPAARATDPTAPDLCADPVLAANGAPYKDNYGQTISRFCDPRVDPPVLDHDVCCSIGTTASCELPDSVGRCKTGMKFWCEYGESTNTVGGVECFQGGPDACGAGFCQPAGSYTGSGKVFDDSSWICCSIEYEECVYVGESGDNPPPGISCAGELTVCSWGETNEDGTVSCLD